MTSFPWPEDGGPPFYEYIKQDAVEQYLPARVGITRRALHDDPTEIVRFALLDLRLTWRNYLTTPASVRNPDGYWNAYLWALAINDAELLSTFDEQLPYPCPRGTSPSPPYYASLYDLMFGVIRSDVEGSSRGSDEFFSRKSIDSETLAVGSTIKAIIDNDPGEVAKGLASMGKSVRRIRAIDPQYKFIDLKMLGVWQLGRQMATDVVMQWNTEAALPWDAGLWHWRQTNATAISTIDFSQVSAEQQENLFALPSPPTQTGM